MSKLYDMQCAADNGGERKLPSFTPPVVPPEFTGKARSLINRVTANAPAVKQAIDRVWQPIEARVAKNRLPRKQTLIDAARQWRDLVPEFGRLKLLIDLQPKRLVVMDMRLSKIAMNLEGWAPDVMEPGLLITCVKAVADKEGCGVDTHNLSTVSLHALARRYQRGSDQSEAAIMDDLRVLSDLTTLLATTEDMDQEFSIPVADGRWVGVMVWDDQHEMSVLAVRSFLS